MCKAAAEAIAADTPVVVAPTLWCGMAEHHMAFGGTFTFDIPTYRAVLLCLLKSIERHGFKRVLIVNGHGGNIAALAAFLPDIARETGPQACASPPISSRPRRRWPRSWRTRTGVHHACEAETSLMMVVAPDTVRREKLAEAHGPAHSTPPPAGIARYRSFRDVTASGVIGDARRASRAEGREADGRLRDGIAAVLRDPQTWS